jgi:hypothetical protein
MGKRTGGRRGTPVGNTNRLKHGRFSARRISRRKEVNALLRSVRNLTRRIEMMGWSRKAMRRKMVQARFSPSGYPTPSKGFVAASDTHLARSGFSERSARSGGGRARVKEGPAG